MAHEQRFGRIRTADPEYGELVFDAVESGPADGPLVLLLHGFPQTKHSYRHQLPVLAAAGYRAVAVDQRGYSPGARPAGVAAYRTDLLTADVLRIAAALGSDRFDLVGHDFGAVVGWQLAARHPEHVRSYAALSVGHPLAYLDAYAAADGEQKARSGYFDWFVDPATDQELGSYESMHRLYLAAGLGGRRRARVRERTRVTGGDRLRAELVSRRGPAPDRRFGAGAGAGAADLVHRGPGAGPSAG